MTLIVVVRRIIWLVIILSNHTYNNIMAMSIIMKHHYHPHHHNTNINPSSRTRTPTTLSSSTTSNENNNFQSSTPLVVIPPPSPSLSMPVWSLACCTTKYLQQQQLNEQTERLNDNHDATTTTNTNTIRNRKNEIVDISLLSNTNTSMNIITFCTSVSVSTIPKLYCISLYYNTFTKDSFITNLYGILQLLRPCHKVLIPILGQHSSYDITYDNNNNNNNDNHDTTNQQKNYYNKRIECNKVGYPWVTTRIYNNNNNTTNNNNHRFDEKIDETTTTSTNIDLIPNCITYLHIKMIHSIPAGDHLLVLCQHINTYQWDDTTKTIIPVSTVSSTTKSSTILLDHNTVLYTGQLREEGII